MVGHWVKIFGAASLYTFVFRSELYFSFIFKENSNLQLLLNCLGHFLIHPCEFEISGKTTVCKPIIGHLSLCVIRTNIKLKISYLYNPWLDANKQDIYFVTSKSIKNMFWFFIIRGADQLINKIIGIKYYPGQVLNLK